MSGTYCYFAGGPCEYNNTRECPKQSVLKHCQVLRDRNREVASDNGRAVQEVLSGE